MADETILTRLDTIETALNEASKAVAQCRADLGVTQRVESANAHEIEKIKRHIAKIQAETKPETQTEHVVAPPGS